MIYRVAAVVLLLAGGVSGADAAQPKSDMAALQDVAVSKGLFLVDVGDPARLKGLVDVIAQTHRELVQQGTKAKLIVVFLGRSVGYLTKDRRGIPFNQLATVTEFHNGLSTLRDLGARLEVCGLAMQQRGVERHQVLPALQVVGNGYISAIGYQNKGYALVPVQ